LANSSGKVVYATMVLLVCCLRGQERVEEAPEMLAPAVRGEARTLAAKLPGDPVGAAGAPVARDQLIEVDGLHAGTPADP
jgi:hypothetical protein